MISNRSLLCVHRHHRKRRSDSRRSLCVPGSARSGKQEALWQKNRLERRYAYETLVRWDRAPWFYLHAFCGFASALKSIKSVSGNSSRRRQQQGETPFRRRSCNNSAHWGLVFVNLHTDFLMCSITSLIFPDLRQHGTRRKTLDNHAWLCLF